MIRLWLDDERPAPPGWYHARTAEKAISILKSGRVVEVSLDHDLGTWEEQSGYDVACFIEEGAESGTIPRLTWNVHSRNPSGASRMIAALTQANDYWSRDEKD